MTAASLTVADLIEHARRFMPDAMMQRDWNDCVAVLAADGSEAREALDAYYRARKSAPGWSPGSWTTSNHDRIPQPVLAAVLGETRRCDECGKPFESGNERTRYCSQRCRKRVSRRTATLPPQTTVTNPRSEGRETAKNAFHEPDTRDPQKPAPTVTSGGEG